MSNVVKFFDRNWIRAFSNVLQRHYYPEYRRVDTDNVEVLQTSYGSFYYTRALQEFPDLFAQIKEYSVEDLCSDDVVIDIGANIGAFTVLAAKKVKHVIAVEPLFFEELHANVALNSLENVTCLPVALGTGDKLEITFCGKTKQIQTMQYDDILTECPYTPNFVKIDCEGGEWAVFPSDLVKNVRAVEGEIHNFDDIGRKTDPEVYKRVLENTGFNCEYSWTPDRQMMIHARR